MAGFIREDKIIEVKNRVDIVDIVSEHVLLKKAGKNYTGLCPFHSEKTPSFTVSPDKQIFYCFGCGAGGNVFKYLMKQDGYSFPEAVKTLARRCGVEIETKHLTPDQRKRLNERENLFSLNQTAMRFYQNNLKEVTFGKKALDYLLRDRGLTRETIETFNLGYATDHWDRLLNHLRRLKIPSVLIEKSGLAVPRKKTRGHYDRFRHRVIFPIFDISKQVIGFGGRVMDDSLPKYLNSPETLLYTKSESLYGLHLARTTARKEETVYVVEGYFDLIALHQHGIHNAVATLGTSLTPEHVKILRGYIGSSGKIVLVFDSDDAGIKAAKRSIHVFEQGFAEARILILESGYDPDTFVFEYGAKSFLELAGRARGTMAFLMESAIKKHGLSVEGKLRIISDLKAQLAAIGDQIARTLYIKELAEKIDIDETAIQNQIREKSKQAALKGNHGFTSAQNTQGGEKRAGDKKALNTGERMERQIITMMLQFPESVVEIQNRNALEYIKNDVLKTIGRVILKDHESVPASPAGEGNRQNPGDRIARIMAGIPDDKARQVVAGLCIEEDAWEMNGCIKLIDQFVKNSQKVRSKTYIDNQIREAEKNNDQELLIKLLKEKQNMAELKEKRKMAILEKR